ncbi:uncharacterized protein I206_101832 [Kwoniella pini CBS 10737]|uniref:Major facilitator superfamily (MFS) profile domain-containing protein n=1 Tax=Kwoniella pini CBS 10737 TaxID=1296096 RepID=A0A1B9HVK9_9TREE|nr:uncharacterized protein I206_07078 [Kwoniella pini CBS 10737]OCF47299.1 hypothetical protein I206_07078 [Kwoniella pini CBS 10737]
MGTQDREYSISDSRTSMNENEVQEINDTTRGIVTPEVPIINDQDDQDEKNELTRTKSLVIPFDELKKLPEGCIYGPIIDSTFLSQNQTSLKSDNTKIEDKIIWVDFPIGSNENPFNFYSSRKSGIIIVATLCTWLTGVNIGSFTIGYDSMMKELNSTRFQASLGNGVYNLGFGCAPLLIAPLSEEFGRRWTYVIAVVVYLLMNIMLALVDATLVGGNIADIFIPADRGLPTAVFSFAANSISECYGSYASLAIAAQRWVRNTVTAAFVFFILSMSTRLQIGSFTRVGLINRSGLLPDV